MYFRIHCYFSVFRPIFKLLPTLRVVATNGRICNPNYEYQTVSKKSDDPLDEVNELLGDPILLQHEELEDYRNLETSVTSNLKPEDLFEALDARDIVNAIWEGQRYHNGAAALINAERRKALNKILDPKSGYVPDTEKSRKAIENFEQGTRDGLGESALLKKLGIDSSAVEAHAVLLAANDYLILDKLVASRTAARRAGVKDYQRRKRAALKAKRAAADAKLKRRSKKGQSKKDSDWDEEA